MFNWMKTAILMAGIVALFGADGMALGGAQGMLIALLVGAGMNVFAYWNSDKMVLRMYNSQEVDAQSGGRYYAIVRELAQNAGLPMPRVYIIGQAQPKAFATGRNPEHAAVAVTQGILRLLTPTELKGVLAHEMGHVRNRDILIQSIAATLGGAIMVLADMARFSAFFGGSRDNEEGGSNAAR